MCVPWRKPVHTMILEANVVLKEKLMRFFSGRYGIDTLGYFLVIASMAVSLASSFVGLFSAVASYIVWVLSYILLGWAIFRMLSRNTYARYNENRIFLGIWKPVKKWFKLQYNRIKDARTHKYFACPSCKNNLRVPKGRGEITVTCPVCKTKFDRKT